MSSEPLYLLTGVGKEYDAPTERLQVLRRIDLRIEPGESVAVIGASGSGKTTLLHIMGTLDAPSSGEVRFAGRPLAGLSVRARAELRNREIGFVFQFHHLLAEFSTLENVAMPGIIGGMDRGEALERARETLALVGLEHRLEHRVTTLSGGERQRAAIARAVLLRPKVVLADEPTGNLDEKTGRSVGELLVSLNRNLGMTFVVVTHNVELASVLGRRLELRSGELYAH
ncbi:MAG TPA: ABC transporter ATP-binding protein [Desulfovibrio sp.]|nr:ABC transporter ATP-binding protein [Desulfovibrio sp.]HBR07026.1 ABC transporter ATP-binding protein [Desulfovibrio sp.]